MEVSTDDFPVPKYEIAIDHGDRNNGRRLTKFVLLSSLLHALILIFVLNFSPFTDTGSISRDTKTLTVRLNTAIPESPPIREKRPVGPTVLEEIPENIVKRKAVIDRAMEETTEEPVSERPVKITKVTPGETLPDAGELVEKGLAYAEEAAKKMESLISPVFFMTNPLRDRLEMARLEQLHEDESINISDELIVYNNQAGDMIYQVGNSCYMIPAVFILQSFKERNTIMATPVPGGCGNTRKQNSISLK